MHSGSVFCVFLLFFHGSFSSTPLHTVPSGSETQPISNASQIEILSTSEPSYQQGDQGEVLEDSETSATDSSLARKDPGESSSNENATLAYDDQLLEGEALGTLLAFLKDTVGSMLKTSMPTIVRGGMESNVSSECANSFLLLMQGLQEGKDWAFKSEFISHFYSAFGFLRSFSKTQPLVRNRLILELLRY